MGKAKTLGELKASGYEVLPVKAEVRRNLIAKLRRGEALFPGIVGYDETVIPQIVNAILRRTGRHAAWRAGRRSRGWCGG